jgi:L-asparaginase/Glu-tRNA(Gln) amidotransferase subunit D
MLQRPRRDVLCRIRRRRSKGDRQHRDRQRQCLGCSACPPLADLRTRGVFVVRASRTGSGALYRGGSYKDDDKRGWIVADDQTPPKARLLTALGLTKTQDLVELRRMFETY